MNECDGRCELCGKRSMDACAKCGGISMRMRAWLTEITRKIKETHPVAGVVDVTIDG